MNNKVILKGRLKFDPKVSFDDNGERKVSAILSVMDYRKTAIPETFYVIANKEIEDRMQNDFCRGMNVIVKGHLCNRQWFNMAGKKCFHLEIHADSIELAPKNRKRYSSGSAVMRCFGL